MTQGLLTDESNNKQSAIVDKSMSVNFNAQDEGRDDMDKSADASSNNLSFVGKPSTIILKNEALELEQTLLQELSSTKPEYLVKTTVLKS